MTGERRALPVVERIHRSPVGVGEHGMVRDLDDCRNIVVEPGAMIFGSVVGGYSPRLTRCVGPVSMANSF